ncbi:MAG TPA: RdgB/HAM1 family non-canonical purine NTP pyrophosphatase [Gammaproteobacteria bacterium]|jgi:XTP/dITP diphosphohydrolase|nr:RdgB/HAM1 family non-canonical purine NTP pyrophosphatase [Gammaproteobacteria bacterium]
MKIVLASSNKGKITEFKRIFSGLEIEVIPQSELHIKDVPETGLTFIENALIKARHASLQSGLPAISDDSGILVEALQNRPGIYSARFAGSHATGDENIQKLLNELKNISLEKRNAFFYCVLVFLSHPEDPTPIIAEGIWQGKILHETRGMKGFGYDPIFYDENEKCSAAELDLNKKNQISHRGKALAALLKKMKEKRG